MDVGITATRHGLTGPQQSALIAQLLWLREFNDAHTLHHGDCVGGDAQGAEIAETLGYRIVSHPPAEGGLRAYRRHDAILPPLPYLERNRAIVDASAVLIGCPDGPYRLLSGTWSTIRYAHRTPCHVIVIMPDGSVS